MPIYEFICRECNSEFEEIVSASRRDAVACPTCGNARTARKISLMAPAVVKSGAKALDYSQVPDCPNAGCCGGQCHLQN